MNTVPFAKSALKEALLAALDGEIAAALNAARQAQETASHEGNKPENQYDTLALEAAYLAHGQSERIRELQETRILIGQWPVPDFSEDDTIASGALIQLLDTQSKSAQQNQRWLWIAPVGGRQLVAEGRTIAVLSTQAPLAQTLKRLSIGDEVVMGKECWEIGGVW